MSLLFAATYSWLAGFAVATERALIMVLVWSLLRWLKRDWPSHRIWLWAFVVLTLWDPFAPSILRGSGSLFLAVALLLLASLLHDRPGLVRLQLLLLLGLLPLQLLLFEGMAPWRFCSICWHCRCSALSSFPWRSSACWWRPSPRCWPTACSGSPPSAWSGCCGAHAAGGSPAALVAGARLADARQRPADPACGRDGTCREGRALGPVAAALLLALWPAPASWQVRVLDVGQGLSVLVTRGSGHPV